MNSQRAYDLTHWGDSLPKVSCICVTYGRPHLLGEAIESFLRQDYIGEKELIILNDHDEIILEIDEHPEITLINEPQRYESLGLKRNAAVEASTGDVLFPWDDDDICMPWRISVTLENMKQRSYFKPNNLLWWTGNAVEIKNGVMSHAMCAYSRELFKRVGGYPDFNSGEDQEFEARVAAEVHRETRELALNDVFYIYRMLNTHTYHLSYYGYGKGLQECEKYVQDNLKSGTYKISPTWEYDYPLLLKDEVDRQNKLLKDAGGLSICVSLKNRSSIPFENTQLKLFPNCIESIANIASDPSLCPIETIVADFASNDWPLKEWIENASGKAHVKVLNIDAPFSRGKGLNEAVAHASYENIMLCDADLLIDLEGLKKGLRHLIRGEAYFPIIRHLSREGLPESWGNDGFGISFVTKNMFTAASGVPEFQSWGGEDNVFYNAIACHTKVVRSQCDSIKHQWHPEECKHLHYSNPTRHDHQIYTSTPGEQKGYHPEELFPDRGECFVFMGDHPQWKGTLHLYEDGTLLRPGVDIGKYEWNRGEDITLIWDRWPKEKLTWDLATETYKSSQIDFTLTEVKKHLTS